VNVLLGLIIALSFLAFVLMGIDKAAAQAHKHRVSEKSFWIVALAGGWLGLMVGGIVFHHKVAKKQFWIPVVFAVILWVLLFYILTVLE
jgi:uncharacterized membrane protein YsdA (DUF1294 family)